MILRRPPQGFTLVELLTVMACIMVLASLYLSVVSRSPDKARRAKCLNNLRQVGIAFHLYASDHDDHFPMQLPVQEGGTREFIQAGVAFRHLLTLSNHLVLPKVLICPTDSRQPADNWSQLRNAHLSYFVALDAAPRRPLSVLSGDRNLNRLRLGPHQFLNPTNASWTSNLHHFQGNLLLSDASTHPVNDAGLRSILQAAASERANTP